MATVWIAVAYILLVLAIGLVMTKKGSGVGEFFVAGRQLSWFLLTPFIVSEFIGTMITVGNAEMAHMTGVVTLWYFIGTAMGFPIVAFGLVKLLQGLKKITIAEAFGVLFDQRNRLVCAIFLLVITAATLGATYLALATILSPLLGIPYNWGVWLSAAIMAFMALLGLRGIAWMNLVHFVVIVFSFAVATTASVNAVGGIGNLFTSLPAEHLNWWRPGWFTVSAWFMAALLLRPISPIVIVAIFAAKDTRTAQISLMSTGLFIVAFATLPMLIGLSAYVIMPDIPSRLALWEMGRYSGTAVSALVSIGVIAAIISTSPGYLLASGGLARDILLRIKPSISENAQVGFSRLVIPLLAFAGTWFALTQATIYGLMVQLVQVQAIFAVVLLISVLWRRLHPTAALWTISLGATSSVIWLLFGSPFGIEPLWPGLGTGILTLIITSLVRRPSPLRGVEGLNLSNRIVAMGTREQKQST